MGVTELDTRRESERTVFQSKIYLIQVTGGAATPDDLLLISIKGMLPSLTEIVSGWLTKSPTRETDEDGDKMVEVRHSKITETTKKAW